MILKAATVILAFVALGVGGMVYVMFRHDILAFKWVERYTDIRMPHFRNFNSYNLSDWVIYSLPDGLWLFAYILLMATIWDFNIKKGSVLIIGFPLLSVISEFLQFLKVLPGTFDRIDVLAYIFAFILGLIYIQIISKQNL